MIPWILALVLMQTPASERINIGDDATLYIPAGTKFADDRIPILLHLHGAPSVVEPAVVAAGWPGVLIEFNRKGLSSVYAKPFADPSLFPRLLVNASAAVKAKGLVADPKLGTIALSTFSAGFGGAREILKNPASFDRVDVVILADSLYCGYVGDVADHEVDPSLMKGFTRFARLAAQGKKTMVVTHSSQVPEGYASTTETATDLIKSLGGISVEFADASPNLGDGSALVRSWSKGRFRVFGYSGVGPEDHLRHLRNIRAIWKYTIDVMPKN